MKQTPRAATITLTKSKFHVMAPAQRERGRRPCSSRVTMIAFDDRSSHARCISLNRKFSSILPCLTAKSIYTVSEDFVETGLEISSVDMESSLL